MLEALRSGDRLLQPENLARIRTPALVIRAELDDLVRPDGQDAFVRGVDVYKRQKPKTAMSSSQGRDGISSSRISRGEAG